MVKLAAKRISSVEEEYNPVLIESDGLEFIDVNYNLRESVRPVPEVRFACRKILAPKSKAVAWKKKGVLK